VTDSHAERTVIVTPAMRAKIEELVHLVVGSLPGYKITDITFGVTMTIDVGADQPARQRVLLKQPCRSRPGSLTADR
jgi:hypothetical protein